MRHSYVLYHLANPSGKVATKAILSDMLLIFFKWLLFPGEKRTGFGRGMDRFYFSNTWTGVKWFWGVSLRMIYQKNCKFVYDPEVRDIQLELTRNLRISDGVYLTNFTGNNRIFRWSALQNE